MKIKYRQIELEAAALLFSTLAMEDRMETHLSGGQILRWSIVHIEKNRIVLDVTYLENE